MLKLASLLMVTMGQVSPLQPAQTLTEGLDNPARIGVSETQIIVADTRADRVVIFDVNGVLQTAWDIPEGPVGVAAHPDGRIFISRRSDARVGVHDASSAFLGFLGEGQVTFAEPTDLAVNSITGDIFVVDSGADRFYKFDSAGQLTLAVGARGGGLGEFRYPSAIAVDAPNNRLFVADQDNYRVQVFTSTGSFVTSFGYRIKYISRGKSEGWMPRTVGIAADPLGRVFVTDALMGTLRMFTAAGAELGKVVEFGGAAGQLQVPGDVAVDTTGRVLVTNSNRGSVETYDAPLGSVASGMGTFFKGTNRSSFDDLLDLNPRSRKKTARNLRSPNRVVPQASLAAADHWEAPHYLEDVNCGRCHDVDGQPGDHLGTMAGQAYLCLSCHSGAGHAFRSAFRMADRESSDSTPDSGGRSHAWDVSAINGAVGSVGPLAGGELDRYLENGKIKCATCHNQHSSAVGEPYLRVKNTDGTLCLQCHSEHVGHTPEGSWQPTCVECHDTHNPKSQNNSLIATSVHNRTLGVDIGVVFAAREGANSFDDGDPTANDGICQACHTETIYHASDGSAPAHHDGETCTSCHPHENGFLPSGGGSCTGCHATVQDLAGVGPDGGRRGVVGEFPVDDAHAHYGATLGDDACLVCHDQTTHQDGNVDLVDADDGSLYTFVTVADLAFDPDLSDFCASCHDVDGAQRLGPGALDPFGNGNIPPNVDERFQGTLQWNEWYGDFCFGNEGTLRAVNSHHDISDDDQAFSGAKLECLSCHGAHAASATQPTADPFDTTTPWTGTGNQFCLTCHGGGVGPLDPLFPPSVTGPIEALRGLDTCDYQGSPWYVDYSWTHSVHGLDSKRAWDGYSGAPEAEVDCISCHDAHGSFTEANPEGNPYMIRDVVDGTAYVDDGVRPGAQWTGPPWDTTGVSRGVVVGISGTDVDWGSSQSLCSACHVDWLAAYDWHAYCSGCQTCHGHGQAWENTDFGTGAADDTGCPWNNVCANGTVLAVGTPVVGTTVSADDDLVADCGDGIPESGVWYRVTGTGTTLTATSCSPDTFFDTSMQVFCDDCVAPTCIGGNNDDGSCSASTTASTVSWCTEVGQSYLIQVGGANGEFGAFELTVVDDAVPCAGAILCPAASPLAGETGDSEVRDENEPRSAPIYEGGPERVLHNADGIR